MILKLEYHEINLENDPYWNDMRSHDYSASFPVVKNFIQQNVPKMNNPKKKKSRTIWLIALFLPLVIFFSCQRKTYIEPQGATLSFTAKDSLLNEIDFIIQQYADKDLKAVFWPRGGTMRGVISTSAKQYDKLKEIAEKLKALLGITELYLSAVKTTVKESPLSRLSYKIFNWHFNAIDASDEQLRMAIANKLKESGQHDLHLQLVKENGKKQVDLVPNHKTRNFTIEVTLPDGSNVTAIGEKWNQ